MSCDAHHPIRRHPLRSLAVCAIVGIGLTSCANGDTVESPTPGATDPTSSGDSVRAPNGTTMGAPPLNAGTEP